MNNSNSLTSIGHLALALVVVAFSSNVNAQTTPTTGGTDNGIVTKSPQQPPQEGWSWWNDDTFKKMEIDEAGMTQLRSIDDRYRADYDKMGKTPWTNAGYQDLTDRRNQDIKGVLTPEQYKQWSTRSSGKPNSAGGTTPTTPNNTPNAPTK